MPMKIRYWGQPYLGGRYLAFEYIIVPDQPPSPNNGVSILTWCQFSARRKESTSSILFLKLAWRSWRLLVGNAYILEWGHFFHLWWSMPYLLYNVCRRECTWEAVFIIECVLSQTSAISCPYFQSIPLCWWNLPLWSSRGSQWVFCFFFSPLHIAPGFWSHRILCTYPSHHRTSGLCGCWILYHLWRKRSEQKVLRL